MKGFVPTPENTVDQMVTKLFSKRFPVQQDVILDPGCGTGVFIEGIIRWCSRNDVEIPKIVGVELDPIRANQAKEKFVDYEHISIQNRDFLEPSEAEFDFIIGNPPYVPITKLDEEEKTRFRKQFRTAKGRFDLYLLFFERSLMQLKPNGRMVLITPEKFLYVETAVELRRMLAEYRVDEIDMIDESTFEDRVAYPTITTLTKTKNPTHTTIIDRSGIMNVIELPIDGRSWLPAITGSTSEHVNARLEDICLRISCGIATGADAVFVRREGELRESMKKFAYPTIAGREIKEGDIKPTVNHWMLVPYQRNGKLLDIGDMADLISYLKEPENEKKLMSRTCVKRKPWYAFHETPLLNDILRPKIIFKDITERPIFLKDEAGQILPRHSVYYLVPKDPKILDALVDYLNSEEARVWLVSHCHRAANGFIRIQSNILKKLPIPDRFVDIPSKVPFRITVDQEV